MSRTFAFVSIGLPVYNSAKYLKFQLDSLLAQTYSNFEIVISDNASNDQTEQICRDYAANDSRIRYYRNQRNIGAPMNHNRVFKLSSGEFFKWAAYDDLHAPTYLEKCMSVLNKDSSIILCHSRTGRINELGELVGRYHGAPNNRLISGKPYERFGVFMSLYFPCWDLFGVIRRTYLEKTPLQRSFVGSDRNLLAEITLMGKTYELPETLFFGRDHSGSYTGTFYKQNRVTNRESYRKQLDWWTADNLIPLPNLKNYIEYFNSVIRVPLKQSEKIACYNQIIRCFAKEGWLLIGKDLKDRVLYSLESGS